MVILVDMDDTIEYLLDAWLEKANAGVRPKRDA